MDKQHVKGAIDKMKGAAKEAAGKISGNPRLQTEGKIDKAKGAVRSVVGDAKDLLRKGR